ncbi:MAG: TIGR02281 family clan AA aspartic protease [Sphingorhabdus sp.]
MKQVLPLVVCAVAIGWFMPSGNSERVVTPEGLASPMQIVTDTRPANVFDSDKEDDVEQLLPDKIVLNRESDGHFYANVDVNSGKIRFLVDTGASMVALTGDDARELGLHWSEDELQPIARGASGDVRGKLVEIERMQIGNFQANNVRAAIVPDGLDVSLLGQSFLARVGSVNIQRDRMAFN